MVQHVIDSLLHQQTPTWMESAEAAVNFTFAGGEQAQSGTRVWIPLQGADFYVVPSEATPIARHDQGVWSRDRYVTLIALQHSTSALNPADRDAFWTLGYLTVTARVCRNSYQNKLRSRCKRTNPNQNWDSIPSPFNTRRPQWVTMESRVKSVKKR